MSWRALLGVALTPVPWSPSGLRAAAGRALARLASRDRLRPLLPAGPRVDARARGARARAGLARGGRRRRARREGDRPRRARGRRRPACSPTRSCARGCGCSRARSTAGARGRSSRPRSRSIGSAASWDGVLLDAPARARRSTGATRTRPGSGARRACSATRSARRDCSTRWRHWSRPGGVLVYSTCSFELAEDEEQVASFLDRHAGWELDDVRESGIAPGLPSLASRLSGPRASGRIAAPATASSWRGWSAPATGRRASR